MSLNEIEWKFKELTKFESKLPHPNIFSKCPCMAAEKWGKFIHFSPTKHDLSKYAHLCLYCDKLWIISRNGDSLTIFAHKNDIAKAVKFIPHTSHSRWLSRMSDIRKILISLKINTYKSHWYEVHNYNEKFHSIILKIPKDR